MKRIRILVAVWFVMTGTVASAQDMYAVDSVENISTETTVSTGITGENACKVAISRLCSQQSYPGCPYGVTNYLPVSDIEAILLATNGFNSKWDCTGTCTAQCAPPDTSGGGTDTQCPGYCCPLIVDFGDKGYDLTSSAEGVSFDIDNDGVAEAISWTAAGAADAFLALDRNGNGTIDSGAELFGAATEQRASDKPNGFAALALFDTADRGGNGDGVISAQDGVWSSLLLWVDRSHDGIAQSDELAPVAASGLNVLLLDVKEAQRRDRHGNRYLYRSSALAEGGLRKIDVVDVFFVPEP